MTIFASRCPRHRDKKFYDQSLLVRESIGGVAESIVIGLFLSAAVLLVFLRDWRITLVASAVIPIAVLIAVVAMRLFNMSFNLMTLGGIAACIGVVIDDAIVIVENIMVHMSAGQTPAEASRSAITELTPALIGSTLTPAMVFVPLIFLGGITAVFFRALALSLVTALLASLDARSVLHARAGTQLSQSWNSERSPPRRADSETFRIDTNVFFAGHWIKRSRPRRRGHHSGRDRRTLLSLGSSFLPEMDEGSFVLDYIMPPAVPSKRRDRVLKHIESFIQQAPGNGKLLPPHRHATRFCSYRTQRGRLPGEAEARSIPFCRRD